MRKIIAAAALLAVTSAHAAEELKFGDLNYFFKQNQINASVDVLSVYDRAEQVGGTKTETRGVVTETQFTYGLMDNLNAFIGLDYAFDLQTETSGNPDWNSDGLANPEIGAIFRLTNQNDSSYNIDLGAIARINIEDAETGSADEDGNYANGRSSLEVLSRIGRKWNEANEWQLTAGVNYFNDGETTEVAVASDTDRDDYASMDIYVRAAYQYRPVNEFMMALSAQATQVGAFDSERTATNVDIERDSHIDMDFRFTAKYFVTENFIAKFHYGMSRNEEYDVDTAGVIDEVQNRRENFFGLGVDFLF